VAQRLSPSLRAGLSALRFSRRSIAGRSTSYIVRQLFDIQTGARSGTLTQQMKAPTAKLTLDDMVAIAAYTASLRP